MSKKNKEKNTIASSIEIARKKLERVYKRIPETTGCLENINKEGGCGAWCCSVQAPQVLYVEFLHCWDIVLRTWKMEDIVDLVRRSLQTYLSNKPTKGCIFFNTGTKLCNQHTTRPFSCRCYGIIPDEEFQSRYEQVKEMLKDKPDADVRMQCDLVNTADGSQVKTVHTDIWWDMLIKVEMSIGVPRQAIHDRFGGSYRTYHDHLILHLFTESVMPNLSVIRIQGTNEEKESAIEKLIDHFKERVFNICSQDKNNGTKDESQSS